MSIVFAIMSFFYKYVDLAESSDVIAESGESHDTISGNQVDESSTLIMDKSGHEQESERSGTGYASESDLDFGDKSKSTVTVTSESEF